jgi:hypothetical protein
MAIGYSGYSDQHAESTCDADALVNMPVFRMLGRGGSRRVADGGCRRRMGFLRKAIR